LEERIHLRDLLHEPAKVTLPIKGFYVKAIDDTESFAKELRNVRDRGLEPIASMTGTLEHHSVFVAEIEANERFDGVSAVAYDAEHNLPG
jgi:hypothetical protein